MLIERQLEEDFINTLRQMPELSASQIVGSRTIAAEGETKTEDDTKATIVAVSCGFRQNDAFSLTPITMSMAISILTRIELDPTSAGHNVVIDAIVDLLSNWHKNGDAMTEALSNEKFFAGELRMDGGTARVCDQSTNTWRETLNISIRGAEKFPPLVIKTSVKYTAASGLSDWEGDIVGELTSSSIPNKSSAEVVEIGSHVTSIGEFAFDSCSSLTSVTIPDSVTSIGGGSFYDCRGLTSITIGNTVTSIGMWAFYNCRGLTSVTIPDSVTSIGESTFRKCIRLTSLTIGNGVTSIGDYTFQGCDGLTSVTLPDSVTSLGAGALRDCGHLTSVTFSGKDKSTVQGMSNYSWGLYSGCILHCTDGNITII